MDGLKIGTMNFQMESNCPNFSLIPQDEIIGNFINNSGTTAVLISVSYEKQEFFRVGYYVRSEYDEGQEQPQNIDLTQLKRYILADSPRIFRFEIEWVAKDTQANYDQNIFNENIGMSGGDPFQSTNGALQALDQMNYSNCMFTNNWLMIKRSKQLSLKMILFFDFEVKKLPILYFWLKVRKVTT